MSYLNLYINIDCNPNFIVANLYIKKIIFNSYTKFSKFKICFFFNLLTLI